MNDRQEAVRRALAKFANEEFCYGVLDCMQFAAAVAKEITGRDYSAGFLYNGSKEAYKIVRSAGSLGELVDSILEIESTEDIKTLEIGDPVLLHLEPIGDVMGIMMGDRVLVKTSKGTIFVSLSKCVRGWSLCQQ